MEQTIVNLEGFVLDPCEFILNFNNNFPQSIIIKFDSTDDFNSCLNLFSKNNIFSHVEKSDQSIWLNTDKAVNILFHHQFDVAKQEIFSLHTLIQQYCLHRIIKSHLTLPQTQYTREEKKFIENMDGLLTYHYYNESQLTILQSLWLYYQAAKNTDEIDFSGFKKTLSDIAIVKNIDKLFNNQCPEFAPEEHKIFFVLYYYHEFLKNNVKKTTSPVQDFICFEKKLILEKINFHINSNKQSSQFYWQECFFLQQHLYQLPASKNYHDLLVIKNNVSYYRWFKKIYNVVEGVVGNMPSERQFLLVREILLKKMFHFFSGAMIDVNDLSRLLQQICEEIQKIDKGPFSAFFKKDKLKNINLIKQALQLAEDELKQLTTENNPLKYFTIK